MLDLIYLVFNKISVKICPSLSKHCFKRNDKFHINIRTFFVVYYDESLTLYDNIIYCAEHIYYLIIFIYL